MRSTVSPSRWTRSSALISTNSSPTRSEERRVGRRGSGTRGSSRRHTRLQGDWSSDVCSSDLETAVRLIDTNDPAEVWSDLTATINDEVDSATDRVFAYLRDEIDGIAVEMDAILGAHLDQLVADQIGRASCREEG